METLHLLAQFWSNSLKKILSLFMVCAFSLSQVFAVYPKVALVLSGGGAKGLAELPVMQALEDAGIPIDFVCGTSQGALEGGLYASGYSPQEIMNLFQRDDIMALLLTSPYSSEKEVPFLFRDVKQNLVTIGVSDKGFGDAPGFIGDQNLVNYMSSKVVKVEGITDFSKLPIPFAAMTTNASTSEGVVLKSGSLVDALRASMSLPVAFTPYILQDGTICMDGGMVDNLPVSIAKEWGADIIIAVDVSSGDLKKAGDYSSLTGVINQTITLATFHGREESQKEADLLILPDVSSFSTLDYTDAATLYQKGAEAAAGKKSEISALAQKIAETRPLVSYDADRRGRYHDFATPVVDSLAVRFVSGETREYYYESLFRPYIGKRLTDDVMADLTYDIKKFRNLNNFSTVSFEFEPTDNAKDGERHGTLVLYIRNWDSSAINLSLGFTSTMGVSNDDANTAWLDSIFSLNFERKGDVNYFVGIDIGELVQCDLGFDYHFKNSTATKLGVTGDLILQSGSLSIASDSRLDTSLTSLGYAVESQFGFDYMNNRYSRTNILADFSFNYLGDPQLPGEYDGEKTWEESIISTPAIKVGYLWNNRENYYFSDEGTFVRVAGGLLFPNMDFGWFGEIKSRTSLKLSDQDQILVGLDIANKKDNYQLTSSYYDIGGFSGIPGYPQYTYRRGYSLLSVTYQRQLMTGRSIYFQCGVKAATFDDWDPTENICLSESSYIMSEPEQISNIWNDSDIGIHADLGLATIAGSLIGGIGVSLSGNVCLMVAFL